MKINFKTLFLFIFVSSVTLDVFSANLVLYNDNGLNNNFGNPTIWYWSASGYSAQELFDNDGHPYDPTRYQRLSGNPSWFGCGIFLNVSGGTAYPVNLSSYYSTNTKLKFYLKLSRQLNSNEKIKVEIQDNSGNKTIYIFQSGQGYYGYNNNNATSWQWISIPLSNFNANWTQIISPFKITAENLDSSLTFWWDFVLWNDDDTTPSVPQLQAPQDGEIIGQQQVQLSWSSVSDPSGVKYWLHISTNSNFSPLVSNIKGITNTLHQINLSNATYYWRIASVDGAGNISSWSSYRRFIIDTSYITAPVLITPTNGLITISTNVFFDWSDVINAVAYNLQVDDNPNFSSPEINIEVNVSSYVSTSGSLQPSTTYYWRVRSKNSQGAYSNFSTSRNFFILSIYTGFVVINDIGTAGYVGVYSGNNGSINLSDDYTEYKEGMKSNKAQYNLTSNASFAGWYVEEGNAGGNEIKDMSSYQNGYLYFWIKTSRDIVIGIRSDNISPGYENSKIKISECGVLLNNVWQEVSIPISQFKNLEPQLDLTQMEVYFNAVVTGEVSGTGSSEFWVDNVMWLSPGTVSPDPDKVYNGLKFKQHPNTGLVRSFENINRAVTYDQALAAMVFTYYADFNSAKRIFDAYKNSIGWTGVGGYAEEYDVTNCSVIKSSRTTGPNLWMLLALMYYKSLTATTEYDVMISSLANWLAQRQDTDGGLKFGYDGSQWLNWKATEHNLTAYAVFKNYAQLTNDNSFNIKANNVKNWLDTYMWLSSEKRFKVGNTVPAIDKALDCYSLAILAFPTGEYNSCIDGVNGQGVDYYFKNTKTCQLTGKTVTGYDFGGPSGNNPDKDAVWLEGTAQMAIAYWVLNLTSSHTYYIDQIEKAVVAISSTSQGIPYATNNGTAYGGWLMDAVNPAVASAAWYLFAKNKFNPLYPFPKFEVSIHRRSDNVEVSSITWNNVSLPQKWMVADQYIKVNCIPNIKTKWGIQIYTDNFALDANPRFTGSTTTINCVGLVYSSNTSRQPLPLCWRLTDDTTNTLTILEKLEPDGRKSLYSQELGANYKCFLWMKDRSTPDIPNLHVTKFVDGEDCVVIWDERGGQHAENTWSLMPTPNYIYIGANFEFALTPAEFKTNKLTLEFFIE